MKLLAAFTVKSIKNLAYSLIRPSLYKAYKTKNTKYIFELNTIIVNISVNTAEKIFPYCNDKMIINIVIIKMTIEAFSTLLILFKFIFLNLKLKLNYFTM